MEIRYKDTKSFKAEELERLFISINRESGKYPEKLARAMENSTYVVSAWDGDKLVGLVRSLSDDETVAFIHYLLVDPEYQNCHICDGLMSRMMKNFDNLLYVKLMPYEPKMIQFYERYGFKQYDNYSAMVLKKF